MCYMEKEEGRNGDQPKYLHWEDMKNDMWALWVNACVQTWVVQGEYTKKKHVVDNFKEPIQLDEESCCPSVHMHPSRQRDSSERW